MSAREQETVPAGRDVEQLPVKTKDKEQHLAEKITTQGIKYKFNRNCQAFRYFFRYTFGLIVSPKHVCSKYNKVSLDTV